MSILVVGSVAYDSVETPFGRAERVLGGSSSFFSVAASFFAPVMLVGVVGEDFGKEQVQVFEEHLELNADVILLNGNFGYITGVLRARQIDPIGM